MTIGVSSIGVSLDSRMGGGGSAIVFPAGIPWDDTIVPRSALHVVDPGGDFAATGSCDLSPEQVFDSMSTARSAPANTYYMGAGGNDGNSGLTTGLKKASMAGCIIAGNATGQPYKVIPDGIEYFRNLGSMSTLPTQDIAIIPATGRMVSGVFDTFTTALDGTYTNCYSVTIGGVDRVTNRLVQNAYGNNVDYVLFSTAAALNSATITADSYAYEGGKLYMRMLAATQPTPTNTRVYRTSVPFFKWTAEVNVYLENIDGEGGQLGVFEYTRSAAATKKCVFVSKNCTAKYGGGNVNTGSRGFSIDGMRGLAYLYNSTANANATDGLNFHDVQLNGLQRLTINCVANDNGRGTAASCNGLTDHEDVVGIDIAGQYLGNHGGSVRPIANTKTLNIGTMATDLGDLSDGTNAAFQCDGGGTAVQYNDRTKTPNASGKNAYAASTTATIHKKNVAATAGTSGGSGTIDNNWP